MGAAAEAVETVASAASTAAAAASAAAEAPSEGGIDMLTLGLSLLLPLLLIALFFLRGSKGARGDKVLLLGPMGAGKTSLYLQLRYGRVSPTFSSMQSTSATFVPHSEPSGSPLQLVDAPGSGRLRARLLEEAASAAVLVCVLDGTQLASQCNEAADMLYDVLALEPVQRRTPPLVLVINKSDQRAAAAALAKARGILEAEIQSVRLARTTLQDTSEKSKRLRGIENVSSSGCNWHMAEAAGRACGRLGERFPRQRSSVAWHCSHLRQASLRGREAV